MALASARVLALWHPLGIALWIGRYRPSARNAKPRLALYGNQPRWHNGTWPKWLNGGVDSRPSRVLWLRPSDGTVHGRLAAV
jgi:hypothetical protein